MDELYVVARRVLLDALEALGAHRDAVVLVGAQAIYLRVGEDDLLLTALSSDDARAFELRVAGPAALLVAKLHKIQERTGTRRESDKDALDVLRLLRGTSTEELAGRYTRLRADSRSANVAEEAVNMLRRLFAERRGIGVAMTLRATERLADPQEIAASCVALAGDLLRELGE